MLHSQSSHNRIFAGSQAIVKALLEVADVNLPNKHGLTPLLLAAARGHLPVIRLLCQHPGLDLQSLDDAGNNALHHAAKAGFLEVERVTENTVVSSIHT